MNETDAEEVVLANTASKRLRLSQDTLNLRELMAIIESGVQWWEHKLEQTEGMAREQAAHSIKDLSRILDSLSQQLEQGRESIQITTRLPVLRTYDIGCPVCGHGNRDGARFCRACGTILQGQGKPDQSIPRPGTSSFTFRVASRSDVGMVRQNNEDTCFTGTLRHPTRAPVLLLLVADGMGGAQAGEVASGLASETVQRTLRDELQQTYPETDDEWQALLRKAAAAANQRIYAQASTQTQKRGMGTTLTTVVIAGDNFHMAHVGDSRAYLVNREGVTEEGNRILQLSNDHTLVARLVDIGQLSVEEARHQPQSNMLYRAIGTEPNVDIDTMSLPLQANDCVLLCSDGLTAYITDEELEEILLAETNPEHICDRLVALANERGGRDNSTVIVANIERKRQDNPISQSS